MKKTLRKILPAIAMLVISAALLGTSTFAWFSMNNKVTITGMSVTTKVGSNLLIKKDTLGSTAKIADANFLSAETDSIEAQLEPVSTHTAKAFFYTTNALSTGDAAADDYVAYNAAEVPTSGVGSELEAFNAAYGTSGAVGYVDYVFQLKAINAQAASKDVKITKLDLTYGGSKDAGKAFRVALFVEDITSSNPAGGSGTLKGIYAPSGAANQTSSPKNFAVSAESTAPTVLATDYNTVANIATLTAGATGYYKVVVRLYLEGEDTTCKNDVYAPLSDSWALDLELKIDDTVTNTAVTCITQYKSASLTIKGVDDTAVVYDGTNLYKKADMSLINNEGLITIPAANLDGVNGAEELAAINTAFGLTGGSAFTIA